MIGWGQDKFLVVEGNIQLEEGLIESGEVQILKNGKRKKRIFSGEDGAYRFELDFNEEYEIVYSHSGHLDQKVKFLTEVSEDRIEEGFMPFFLDILLYKASEGIAEPSAAKIEYSTGNYAFDFKQEHMRSLKSQRKQLLAYKSGVINFKEKEFNDLIALGDQKFQSTDYRAALNHYNEALKIKPTDELVQQKIDNTKAKLDEIAAQNKKEQQYNDIIQQADGLLNAEDYERARIKYADALKIKPTEVYPKNKITEIDNILDQLALAKEKQQQEELRQLKEKQFQEFVSKGDIAFDEQKYKPALTHYQSALDLKPDDNNVKDKIQKTNEILQEIALKQQNEKEYAGLVAEADQLFNEQKYTNAKDKYQQALDIKQEEYPKSKIKEIEQLLASIADENQKKQEFDRLVALGNQEFSNTQYQNAIDYYEQALLNKEDKDVRVKIEQAKDKIKEIETQQENDQKYSQLIADGDQLFQQKQYEQAKTKYRQAIDIKQEQYPKSKIDEIEQLLALIADENQKKQEFDRLVALGNQEFSNTQYQNAIDYYEQALTNKEDEDVRVKIEQARDKIKEIETQQENDQKYSQLIADGDQLFQQKQYEQAKTKYQRAIDIKEEQYPKSKIKEIEQLLASIADENQKKQEFDRLVALGNQEFSNTQYQNAIDYYEQALTNKEDEDVRVKIEQAKDKIKEIETQKENDQKYSQLIADGDQLFQQKRYEQAKTKYRQAIDIKEEQYPKSKIDEIEQLLALIADENQKKQEFDRLVALGNQEFSNTQYQNAIDYYEQALTNKEDEEVRVKIEQAKDKIKEIEIQKENDQKYSQLIADGDQLFQQKRYEQAKTKYRQAIDIKEEQYPKSKIDEIEQLLALIADENQKKQEFDRLVALGNQEFSNTQYQNAIDYYEQALTNKEDEDVRVKIEQAKDKIKEIETQKENDQKYSQLIADGDQLFQQKRYEQAKTKYQGALDIKEEQYPKSKIDEIEQLLALIADENQKKQEFDRLVALGNQEFSNTQYQNAIDYYEQALTNKEDEDVRVKIEQAKDKIKEIETQKKNDQKYSQLIADGDQLFQQKQYEQAKTKYQGALDIKEEQYPKSKIDEIEQLLALIADENQKKQEFDRLVALGNQEFSNTQYQNAINYYEQALTNKEDEGVKAKIEQAKDKIKEIEIQQENDQKYSQLIADGDQLFQQKQYEQAKTKYQGALDIKEEQYPKSKIDEIEQLLALIADENQKKQEFDRLVALGNQEFSNTQYQNAIDYYEQALTNKEDEGVKAKIEQAKDKIKEIETQQENDQKYSQLIADGDQLFQQKQYEQAKTKYQGALDIKEEQYPKSKIDEIEQLLALIADENQKKQEFDRLVALGNQEFSNTQYQNAINYYEQALTNKEDEGVKAKIEQAKDKIKEIEIQQENDQKYSQLIADGDQLFQQKQYEQAKTKYQGALDIKEEQYPKSKIDEIEQELALIAQKQEKDKNFNTLVNQGDDLYAQAKYESAIKKYQEAISIKPNEQSVRKKIKQSQDKLNEAIAQAKLEEQYNTLITEADQLFNSEQWETAKGKYQEAFILKKATYPEEKIQLINKKLEELAAKADREKRFNELLAQGDAKFDMANYEEALVNYQAASSVLPENNVVKNKISTTQAKIKELKQKEKLDQQYDSLITTANRLFGREEYEKAESDYKKASNLKPNEEFPTLRIKEIKNILVEKAKEAALLRLRSQHKIVKFNNDEERKKVLSISEREAINSKYYITLKPYNAAESLGKEYYGFINFGNGRGNIEITEGEFKKYKIMFNK